MYERFGTARDRNGGALQFRGPAGEVAKGFDGRVDIDMPGERYRLAIIVGFYRCKFVRVPFDKTREAIDQQFAFQHGKAGPCVVAKCLGGGL